MNLKITDYKIFSGFKFNKSVSFFLMLIWSRAYRRHVIFYFPFFFAYFNCAGLIFTRHTEEHFFQIRISQPLVGIDTSFLAVSDGEIEYYPLVIIRTLFGCQGMRNLCVLAQEHFF